MAFQVFLILGSGCVLEKFFFLLPPLPLPPQSLFLSKSIYILHDLEEAAI